MPDEPDLRLLYAQCVQHSGKHPDCERLFVHLYPVFKRIAGRLSNQFGEFSDADDVVQEITLKLMVSGNAILDSVPQEHPGALAYFSVLAANAARDYFRAKGAAKRGARQTLSLEGQLERVWVGGGPGHSMERDFLINEIERALPGDRRERLVFRLYYRQGFTAKEIAAIPALELSVKGVESLIYRVGAELRRRLESAGQNAAGERRPEMDTRQT